MVVILRSEHPKPVTFPLPSSTVIPEIARVVVHFSLKCLIHCPVASHGGGLWITAEMGYMYV